jgi:hypothetical protein
LYNFLVRSNLLHVVIQEEIMKTRGMVVSGLLGVCVGVAIWWPVIRFEDSKKANIAEDITAERTLDVGGVSEHDEELTRDSVFTVDQCERTPDANLFNCLIVSEGNRGSAWRFSTGRYEHGAKVMIVTEFNESDGEHLALIERADARALATLGIK